MAKKKSKEIKTVPFLTDIPEGTISLEINAKILIKGEIVTATMTMDDSTEIRHNMVAGEEYVLDHEVFALTDKALTELGDK